MEFSRQEYWSGLPFPPLGHLQNTGIKPGSPALQAGSLLSVPSGKPKVKLAPKTKKRKKVIVTLWWSAAGLIHYNLLNPGKTIVSEKYVQQINEMDWKWQRLQPALVNRMGPILFLLHVTQPMLQKLNKLSYKVLPHLPYNLLPANYHFFSISTVFCRENPSTASRMLKMLSKMLVESQNMGFYVAGIKLISHWQKSVDSNNSYFN